MILILNIILLFISIFLIYKSDKIKVQRNNQINRIQQQINTKQYIVEILEKNIKDYQLEIEDQKNTINTLTKQKIEITQEIKNQEKELNQQYDKKIQKYNKEFESFCNSLNDNYKMKEEKLTQKIDLLNRQRESVEGQLDQVKKVYQAATAARIREQQEKEKKIFYQLQIPEKQISDIKKLEQWKNQLNDPSIVSKIIWSSYVIKPTSDLCNRILGSSIVCGIYKITNQLTKENYIGQSVNISDRFKQHIKCGLGIDASSTNKLYNNMQKYGVWNFTFELLQKCNRDKLNEKERFWIEMYQSNKVGMNITKGNK